MLQARVGEVEGDGVDGEHPGSDQGYCGEEPVHRRTDHRQLEDVEAQVLAKDRVGRPERCRVEKAQGRWPLRRSAETEHNPDEQTTQKHHLSGQPH